MVLGDQIREWRSSQSIGRKLAAQRLGVSQRTLEAWEQNRREPQGALRQRVLSVLLGRHEAEPDLSDALREVRSAAARIERALRQGDISIGNRDRLPRIACSLQGFADEIERMLGKELEFVPPAGSIL